MYKLILNVFKLLKSFLQFLKILNVFLIMMLLLYWTEQLIGQNWGWLNFIKPLLGCLVNAGKAVSDGSTMLFAAVFEYKYFWALVFLLFIYAIFHLSFMILDKSEKFYIKSHEKYNQFQETCMNASFALQQTYEQKKLQSYYVYVAIKAKEDKMVKYGQVDLKEQEKLLKDFLTEKTGVSPRSFEKGFLYSFEKFDDIDTILSVLFKVLKSEAPVDYQICILIREGDKNTENDKLRALISLGFVNKISALSNAAYRYRFVEYPKYETSQLGLFQKKGGVFEAHEFVERV